ncbi:MAG: TRL-like family protein [Proteobacteria bacterium]|nr:TRL-like family protein [Pseudomonadota bacterium]MBU1715571.1 TRL-like family protein [Pseudomonadota bacterium]
MRSCLNLLGLILIAFVLNGCIYSHVQWPLDTDFDSTSLGTKVGRSHIQSVFWLFAWGDGGSKAAAEDGGITIINHADTEVTVVLFGLYYKVTTVVYGD